MTMFTNLFDEKLIQNINLEQINSICIPAKLCLKLQALLSNYEKEAKVNTFTTTIINSSNNYIFFPNQYYEIAAKTYPLAIELNKYCNFLDKYVRKDSSLANELNNKSDKTPILDNLLKDSDDKKSFLQFINGRSNKLGKDVFCESGIRGTKELFGSCILRKLNIPAASSEYLGILIYYLSNNLDIYSELCNELNNSNNYSLLTMPLQLPNDKTIPKEQQEKTLGEILSNEKNTVNRPYSLHYFGIRYSEWITENNLDVNKIIDNAGIQDSYTREIQKCLGIIKLAKEDGFVISGDIQKSVQKNQQEIKIKKCSEFIPQQIIYYGVPGSGKSYKIEECTKKNSNERKIRVVFHPEYTNADFVGQIVPCLDDTVEYRFKAGPFSRILKKALKDPVNQYFLIIEEINRGNAAAIFGDLFQLLDRDEDGWSEYGVDNLDINAFIRSNDNFFSDKVSPSNVVIGNQKYTENTSIRLPPNLSILATMNTSDQNVFTLDNAFQRRWDMKLIQNKLDENSDQYKAIIGNTNLSWGIFREQINSMILQESKDSGLSSMEDKRLGPWFIKAENKKINSEAFADKVLKYLWDDAFKFSRSNVFEDSLDSFEKVRTAFLSEQKIFRNLDLKSINSETTETDDESLETSEE